MQILWKHGAEEVEAINRNNHQVFFFHVSLSFPVNSLMEMRKLNSLLNRVQVIYFEI